MSHRSERRAALTDGPPDGRRAPRRGTALPPHPRDFTPARHVTAGALLGAATIFLLYLAADERARLWREIRLSWDHEPATATVTDAIYHTLPGSEPDQVDVIFDAGDRRVRARLLWPSPGYAPGDPIAVDYLPSHPETIRAAGTVFSAEAVANLAAGALVGSLTLTAVGYGLHVRRSRRAG